MTDRFGSGKANDIHLKISQYAILETIDEPMHSQFATTRPGVAHERGATKSANLENHIDFAELFHLLDNFVDGLDLFTIRLKCLGNRRKPVIDEPDRSASEGSLHPPATVMATNDDVDNFEDVNGVLDGREAIEVGREMMFATLR